MTAIVRRTSTLPGSRRPAPALGDAVTLHDLVTDVSCTRCTRQVRNITLFEVAWSRPCPLCKRCPECRRLCTQGLVEHGLEPGA